ncbi:MAG: hypothetical protein ABFD50_04530 [Smithella sp.]
MKRKYTDEQFIEAVKNSTSIRETLSKLDVAPTGGSYKQFYLNCKRLNIDYNHFNARNSDKEKYKNKKNSSKPLDEILKENSNYTSSKLSKRLIKEGFFERKCYSCNLTEWLSNPIPIEIHHINGVNTDNRIENLTLLCPNCHAFTDNYCSKNKTEKNKQKEIITCYKCNIELSNKPKNGLCSKCKFELETNNKIIKHCIDCDAQISNDAIRCKHCNSSLPKEKKIVWLPIEELLDMLSKSNYSAVAKQLGVSDNAIRKHIKNHKKQIVDEVGIEPT